MNRILQADGSEQNSNGMGEMPWQVRAIAFFGVPSAIAIFLVWNMAGAQAKDIADAKAQLAAHTEATATYASAAAVHAATSDAKAEELKRILRRICINTLRNPAKDAYLCE